MGLEACEESSRKSLVADDSVVVGQTLAGHELCSFHAARDCTTCQLVELARAAAHFRYTLVLSLLHGSERLSNPSGKPFLALTTEVAQLSAILSMFRSPAYHSMKVNINQVNGDGAIVLPVSCTETTEDLKDCISAKIGIPPARQRLVFAGKELAACKMLRDAMIRDDCVVHLMQVEVLT